MSDRPLRTPPRDPGLGLLMASVGARLLGALALLGLLWLAVGWALIERS